MAEDRLSDWASLGVPEDHRNNVSEFSEFLPGVYGVVSRLLTTSGCISVKEPVKALVSFEAQDFECGTKSSMEECGLNVGSIVMCNAKKKGNGMKTYQATKVWRPENKKNYVYSDVVSSEKSFHGSMESLQSCTSIESNQIENKIGVILSVFPKYGFIRVNRNPQDNIYFHSSVVEDASGQTVGDANLPSILAPWDKVLFSACLTSRSDASSKWEATFVRLHVDDDAEEKLESSDFPETLSSVKGNVYRSFPAYGFISIAMPVRTQIYFHVSKVKCGTKPLLDDYNIRNGTRVVCNAVRAPKAYKARYMATHVWLPEDSTDQLATSSSTEAKSPDLLEMRNLNGIIDKLQTSFGFIRQNRNKEDNVYFHISVVEGLKPGEVLEDHLSVGQRVMFSASTTARADASVQLQATRVWTGTHGDSSMFQDTDELYMSESSEEEADVEEDEQSSPDSPGSHLSSEGVQSNGSEESEESDSSVISGEVNGAEGAASLYISGHDSRLLSSRRKLQNQTGKIYYLDNSLALIKFGSEYQKKALALMSVVYKRSIPCVNLEDEIEDGESVMFNAVEDLCCPSRVKWKATLAWDRFTILSTITDTVTTEEQWQGLKERYLRTQYIRVSRLYLELRKLASEEMIGGAKKKKRSNSSEFTSSQVPKNVLHKPSLTGCITRVAASVKATTKSLEKPVLIQFQNIYINNKCIVDLGDPCEDVLKKGDVLYFEYCKVMLKSGKEIEVIPVAWKDKKPKLAEDLLHKLFKLCKDLDDDFFIRANRSYEVEPTHNKEPVTDYKSDFSKVLRNKSGLVNSDAAVIASSKKITVNELFGLTSGRGETKNMLQSNNTVDSEQEQLQRTFVKTVDTETKTPHLPQNSLNISKHPVAVETEVIQSSSDGGKCFETANGTHLDDPDNVSDTRNFIVNVVHNEDETRKFPTQNAYTQHLKYGFPPGFQGFGNPPPVPFPYAPGEAFPTNKTPLPVDLSSASISVLMAALVNSLKPALDSLPSQVGEHLKAHISDFVPTICSSCQNVAASKQQERTACQISEAYKCDMWTQTDEPPYHSAAVQVVPEQRSFSCQAMPSVSSSSQQTLSTGTIHSQNLYHC